MKKLLLLSSLGLLTACSGQDEPVAEPNIIVERDGISFCDLAERRRYTAEEYAWRKENAAWNLDRDHRHNAAMKEFCPDKFANQGPNIPGS